MGSLCVIHILCLAWPRRRRADEVKKAFRKLAKKYHPDQNKVDPKAQEKFAEASSAYDLGDEERGQFDRGEIDAEGKPRGFEGFGAGGPGGFAGVRRRIRAFRIRCRRRPVRARRRRAPGAGFDPSDFFSDLFGGGRAAARASRNAGRTPTRR